MGATAFFSRREPMPPDWHQTLPSSWQSSPVPWVSLTIDKAAGSVTLVDDEGQRAVLALAADRPAGMFDQSSLKLLVGFFRLCQILGFDVAYDSVGDPLTFGDPVALRDAVCPDVAIDRVEDMLYDIGLAPREFRLRHLRTAPGVDLSV